MADKTFVGTGSSSAKAMNDLGKRLKKSGLKTEALTLEYTVSLNNKAQGNLVGEGKGGNYGDALQAALGAAGLTADSYKPRSYDQGVVIRGGYSAPRETAPRASGAAPMYGSKSDITSLF